MEPTLEIRKGIELRTAQGRKHLGYAAVFNNEARIADFTEIIRPGAFSNSLGAGADILALADHYPAKVLARTKSGTLMLSEDSRGLAFEIALPDTQVGRDVLTLAERGDLGGMSFGFLVGKGGDRWRGDTRELLAVDLREISVVSAWPAYGGTTVQARSKLPPRLAAALRFMETI